MKFQQGNRYGSGRPKGKKNKKTLQWEMFAEYCMNEGLQRFSKEFGKLKGRAYVSCFLQLLEYFKPKLGRTDITSGKNIEFTPIQYVQAKKEIEEMFESNLPETSQQTSQNGSGTH